jgi:hypothetical protein
MSVPTPENEALLERIFAGLDYARLGPIYCDEGGDEFWLAHRQPVLTQGVPWSRALARRLSAGASLYVGAGVAELPALVTEVVDLGRRVRVATLNEAECDVVNACLREVGIADRLVFENVDAATIVVDGGYDHLSLVSVLNDPENYPVVSGLSYGRLPPVLLDVEHFQAERSRLRELVAGLLRGLNTPGLVTTTFEEVAWLLDGAASCGLDVETEDEAIETAIVGDPVGFLRVTSRAVAT